MVNHLDIIPAGDWKGPVGMNLGGTVPVRMFFDFEDRKRFAEGVLGIRKEIDKRLKNQRS